MLFFLFFSQNWTKCLGWDLEVGIRNANLKSLDMARARDRPGISLGSNYKEGPKLGIGPGSMFRDRDWLRIKILGLDPSLVV